MKVLASVIFTLLISVTCFADAGLYLYPKVERGDGAITIADIAKIEADPETSAQIGGIAIEDKYFSDGYLDRKEIMDLLKGRVAGRISIYGGGVRITATEPAVPEESRIAVVKGNTVRFQVVNSGIRVELTGTAMRDGAVGDVIPVKLKGSAVARGTVVNERVVELAL
jgi:hypothetical protein